MITYDLLLIDPPMSYFSEKDNDVSSLLEIQETPYVAFNPGLLSIGSYIIEKGYSVKLKHIISDKDIDKNIDQLKTWGVPRVIGVSCSYFQTYENSLYICSELRKLYPDSVIVIGGQHAGNIPAYVLYDCLDIDIVSIGEGEGTFEDLLGYIIKNDRRFIEIGGVAFGKTYLAKDSKIDLSKYVKCKLIDFINDSTNIEFEVPDVFQSVLPARIVPLDDMPFLHYDLYENYLTYPCYVEESRGCYGNCNYCVAPIYGNFRIKSATYFLEELDRAVSIYGIENNYPFLASNFGVNVENTLQIFDSIKKKYKGKLHWNAEFRVDLNWEKYIDAMYEAGCRGFNIGVDSPCKSTLELMNKSADAEHYLNKTRSLIQTISKYPDAAICVNLMFYPGEDVGTIRNVIHFIDQYYEKIAAVHYSPTNLYYGTTLWKNFNWLNKQYGTRIVKTPYFDRVHVYPLHPSRIFDNSEANYWCRIIEKIFSEKPLFAEYHETRLTRDESGHLSADDKIKSAQIYINNKID